MNITMAQPSEADALSEIAWAAKRHWGYPEHWLAHWRSALVISPEFIRTHVTVAARGEEGVLGFAALAQEGDLLRLEHLWVRPAAMGRGVGCALFREMQRRAGALGFSAFEIESDPHAAGFYEHMGAERIGSHPATMEDQPRALPVYRCRTF